MCLICMKYRIIILIKYFKLNIVSPCVVVCLKFIKTETFCNLLNFLYLSRILKMMVQMHLACYTGGIFLYDIRAHTYDLSNVQLGNK